MVILLFSLHLGCQTPEQDHRAGWTAVSVDSSFEKSSESEAIIDPYRELLEEEMNRVLVMADTIIYKVSPESPLSNLIADLSFERASLEAIDLGIDAPDLCLLNFGGLRVDLPAGEIKVGKVFELMPFENTLEIIELSADSAESLFKYLASVNGQPVANLSIVIEDGSSRSILISEEHIDKNRSYRVVTTDYLANGGDKMSFFQNPVSREALNIKLRDAIIDHFEAIGKSGNTLNPKMDGRISIAE